MLSERSHKNDSYHVIYQVLHDKQSYLDLGSDYFDQLDAERIQRHHIRRLEQFGYLVTLTLKDADAVVLSS